MKSLTFYLTKVKETYLGSKARFLNVGEDSFFGHPNGAVNITPTGNEGPNGGVDICCRPYFMMCPIGENGAL